MKHPGCIAVLLAWSLIGTGCQTAPKGKPLTELTEAEQVAYNQTAPMGKPGEPGVEFEDVLKTAGAVMVFLPILVWESLAWGGTQISTGK
ncbi:MAG TPA: hypothetical protein VIO38_06380 [Rariglobus sp.]